MLIITVNRKEMQNKEELLNLRSPSVLSLLANHTIPYRSQGKGKKRDRGNEVSAILSEKEQDKFKKD